MNGGFAGLPYNLIEERRYTDHAATIGEAQLVDRALVGMLWAIATNPEFFPIVHERPLIRLAKTTAYVRSDGAVPRLRIWFRLDLDTSCIHLLDIASEPGYYDDEIPF